MGRPKAIINGAILITLVIGTLKSILVDDHLPEFRYFFGVGILYFFLNGLETFESEIAKNIALAIAVFITLRDGGVVLDQFLGAGTTRSITGVGDPFSGSGGTLSPKPPTPLPTRHTAIVARPDGGVNSTSAMTGFMPVRPA